MSGAGTPGAWISASVILLAVGSPPVRAQSASPHAMGAPDARAHVLAVAAVKTPPELRDPDRARLLFERLIVEQLEAAGFRAIPPAEFQPVLGALADSIAGHGTRSLLSPVPTLPLSTPGEIRGHTKGPALSLDEAKAARSASLERIGADAIVEPELLLTLESPAKGRVVWYGTKAEVPRGSENTDAVYAYSLLIRIIHADGSVLHSGTGGIELTSKPKQERKSEPRFGGGKHVVSHSLHEAGREKPFKKERRNRHAVRFALTPFAASEQPEK